MKRVFLLALGLLLLCFPLIGCDSEDESLDSGEIESILKGVSTSTSEMDTMTFDMVFSADLGIESEGVSLEASVDGSSKGSMDMENEEMYIPVTIDAEIPYMDSQSIDVEMYIVNGWMYMNTDGEWIKTEVPEEVSELQDQSALIGQLTGLLDLVEIEDKGSETINGVECHKFYISPDLAELLEYVFAQLEQEGVDTGDMNLSDAEEVISAFSVEGKFWISKEDKLLMKVDLKLSGDLSSGDIPETDLGDFGSIDVDVTAQIEFEYDQPVSIELPEEALDAYEEGYF